MLSTKASPRWARGAAMLPVLLACSLPACAPTPKAGLAVLASSATQPSDSPSAEAACLAGLRQRCREASRALLARPLDATPARLSAVLEIGCREDDGEACRVLAAFRRDSPAFLDEAEATKARFQRACDLGDGIACLNLIDRPAGPAGKTLQAPASRATIEQACRAGQGAACVGASMLAAFADHDPDARRAWTQLAVDGMEAACFAGDTPQCELAAAFAPTGGVRLEPMRYRLWLETGCRGDALDTCKSLATSSAPLSPEQRRGLLQKACDGQRSDACFALVEPPFVAANLPAADRDAVLTRALLVARAQCDLGISSACSSLAENLSLSFVTEAEQRRLTDYLEPACRDNMLICVQLARSLARGNTSLRDPMRIAKLEAEACKRGYPFTCPEHPFTILGVYRTPHASFWEERTSLEWAPIGEGEMSLTEAERHCAALSPAGGAAFRLPTRTELETLSGAERKGKLATFARVWLPHRGALFSSDVDGAGVRLRFDAHSGDVFSSDRSQGLAGCVRSRDEESLAGRPTVRFVKVSSGLGYALVDEKGRVSGRPRRLDDRALDAVIARVGNGPFDADVAADADWRGVTDFLAEVEKRRTRVGVIVVRSEAAASK